MNRFQHGLISILGLVLLTSGCVAGPFARTGTAVGGLTGGAIGAAAGASSGKSLEGAAVGALAGSVLGGAVGHAADRDAEQWEAQQAAWQQEQLAAAVTLDEVIQLTQSGVGDAVIANQIRAQGVTGPLSTSDLVFLKQNGVSDVVITAWQQTPVAGSVVLPAVRPAPQQIIVRERYVDPCFGPDFYYGPRPRWHHGQRAALHFSF